jgi:hypothetical protein
MLLSTGFILAFAASGLVDLEQPTAPIVATNIAKVANTIFRFNGKLPVRRGMSNWRNRPRKQSFEAGLLFAASN